MTLSFERIDTLPPEGEIGVVDVGPLNLESGAVLEDVSIAVQRWGELSPTGDNVVIVLHALTGDSDVRLGELFIGGIGTEADIVPVWMSRSQFEYWRHTHLTIDVVPGRGAGFSLEAPTGQRFLIRSRLLTDEELAVFEPEVFQA